MSCPCTHRVAVRRVRGLGQAPSGSTAEVNRDVVSGVVAFGVPVLYHVAAPKKWPRLSTWGNVGAVVGIYLLTSFIYTRVTAA